MPQRRLLSLKILAIPWRLSMHPAPKILDDLVRRIVGVVPAQRIMLCGSVARGDMGPNSDN
jgi:hypothetical protein